ncbi:MAG: amidohydrolase [Bacteroidales bacterium]|nr:amidohydrolase [Bacteroidales bacterium]
MKKRNIIYMTALMMTIASCGTKNVADLLLVNGNIYTVDEQFSSASQLAIKNGKIVYVGDDCKMKAVETIDLKGRSVYPGFIDGHCHFVSYGENCIRYVDLKGCLSFDEVIERLKDYERENGTSDWLIGRGWDQNLWPGQQFPTNKLLEVNFPGKHIVLTRIDGHATLVTSNVLALAGINAKSDIEGGDVFLDGQGRPTGLLLDNAADMAKAVIPPLSDEQLTRALLRAEKDCFALGLTSVTDAGLGAPVIDHIDKLQQGGILKIKVNAMINPDEETLRHFTKQGVIEKERLTVRSVKLYADGALGSRGAKLLAPYSDAPETDGLIVCPDSLYRHVCQMAYDAGYQVCTHCIGDGGVRHMLQIYGEFLKGSNDRRWRIEHSQVVDAADFDLYHQYNIIPSIQATHCTSDMGWAGERLGDARLKNAYAYKTLLQQNGWLVNGTDFPIEHISPIFTFYASVARKNNDGLPMEGFQMENALTRKEALRSMTIWAAKGAFEENRKGSLEVGKDADIVVLSHDIMAIPINEILKVKVERLFVQGEQVLGER